MFEGRSLILIHSKKYLLLLYCQDAHHVRQNRTAQRTTARAPSASVVSVSSRAARARVPPFQCMRSLPSPELQNRQEFFLKIS